MATGTPESCSGFVGTGTGAGTFTGTFAGVPICDPINLWRVILMLNRPQREGRHGVQGSVPLVMPLPGRPSDHRGNEAAGAGWGGTGGLPDKDMLLVWLQGHAPCVGTRTCALCHSQALAARACPAHPPSIERAQLSCVRWPAALSTAWPNLPLCTSWPNLPLCTSWPNLYPLHGVELKGIP